jgi:hypothetical protein
MASKPTPVHPLPIGAAFTQHRTEQDAHNIRPSIEGTVGPTLVDVGVSAGGRKLKALRRPTAGELQHVGQNVKLRTDGSALPVSGQVVRSLPDVARLAHGKTRAINAAPGPAIHLSTNAAVAEKSRAGRKARKTSQRRTKP